jgi:hypothetical protein
MLSHINTFGKQNVIAYHTSLNGSEAVVYVNIIKAGVSHSLPPFVTFFFYIRLFLWHQFQLVFTAGPKSYQ